MFVLQSAHNSNSNCNSNMTSCSSPAISEISVGSPSPPPVQLSVKRLRLLRGSPTAHAPRPVAPIGSGRKCSQPGERIKSFSIADILGRDDECKPAAPTAVGQLPVALPVALPLPLAAAAQASKATHAAVQAPPAPTAILWDPAARGANTLNAFLSPALLHSYEQRLAWDYQRQLQEHFQAQAHLLRQMSMDPAIIPSEDGSEPSRSRSSSNGSTADCCTPTDSSGKTEKPATNCSSGGSAEPPKLAAAGGDTPLDALFQLSTKNFDEEQDPATLNIFATRPNPKKKRKSRTAFTNQQIFELEKRFLYQKYLSPADRDEIAAGLGLSNAQVITWFQNRRAKLKRDMEELKKDVASVKQLHDQSADKHPTHRLHHPHHPHHQMPQSDNSSAAKDKDKEELRLLKLMTLMRYSDGKLLLYPPQPLTARPAT